MSDGREERARDPALGIVEFTSIALGIVAGDAMIKAAPLGSIYVGTVHPGKYLVLVSGDTASVDVALAEGRDVGGEALLDSVFLPDIHPAVTAAVTRADESAEALGDALGIVETVTAATVLEAADAGVKAAAVDLSAVRLADGLGGKGYALFSGVVSDVEAAMEAAAARAESAGRLERAEVIPQLHDDMKHNLLAELRFMDRLRLRRSERET